MEEKQSTQRPAQSQPPKVVENPEKLTTQEVGINAMHNSSEHIAPPIKNNMPKIIIAAVILVVVIIGAIWLWWRFLQPAFTIGDKSYSKTQYYKMMDAAKKNGVNQKEATARYIEIEKKRIAAEELKIVPSEFSQSAIAANLYNGKALEELDLWQTELVYSDSLSPAINLAKEGGYTGAYFNFPFSKRFQALSFYQVTGQSPTPDGYGNLSKIEDDKVYAKQQFEKYHKEIKEGGSSSRVVAEIRADDRLDLSSASNGSAEFQTNKEGIQQLSNGSFIVWNQKIAPELFKGKQSVGVSELQVRKVIAPTLPGSPVLDGAFYFVKFENYSDGNPEIQKLFDEKVQSLKVVKNV